MGESIQMLLVEDDPSDAELVLRALHRAGFAPVWRRVDTEAEYLARLEPGLDIVLSDYAMPQFNGLRALALLREREPDIPFILISGTVGEDMAVAAMKLGAADYLLKDRLTRLGPAVSQALAQSRLRREHRAAEAALRQSEERLRTVVETIQEMVWIALPGEVRPVYVSPACQRIWGRPAQDLVEHPTLAFETIHADDRDRFLECVRRQLAGQQTSLEFRILRPDGSVRCVWDQGFPVVDAAGKVTSINGIAADITERKQLEEQLRQSQKMEAIGQLAGGVAHDFNNLLTVIQCNATLLLGGKGQAADAPEIARQILDAAERAAALTRQLLLFSRKQAMQSTDLDLGEIVSNLSRMLRRILGENITLTAECAADLPPVPGDGGMIEQSLMNLVVNARDAMPQGGRVTLTALPVTFNQDTLPTGTDAPPGDFVRLSVSDTGTGIAPENLPHIFEPFFTTKEVGKGTGLGLATVYGIVKQHRGWIDVRSQPGHGTTFDLYLPAIRRTAAVRKPVRRSDDLPAGTEVILVVEDEPALRALAKTLLTRCGYTVLEAATGAAALEVWAGERTRIDLVLTDLILPDGLAGHELATRLLAERPGLKIIYTSGYSPDGTAAARLDEGSFLQKPYSPFKLARFIRDRLDRK